MAVNHISLGSGLYISIFYLFNHSRVHLHGQLTYNLLILILYKNNTDKTLIYII